MMRKYLVPLIVPGLLAGCFEKDGSYKRSTERSPELIEKSQIDLNKTYLYVPSTSAVPRYAAEMYPFFQGDEKLVQVQFTKSGLEVYELDKDVELGENGAVLPGRYVAENETYEHHPVLTIPGDHIDFRCAKDQFDECTNTEETVPEDPSNKDAWKEWGYFKPDYTSIQQHELNTTNLWFENSSISLQKTEVISYEISDGVIDIELEKTFQVNESSIWDFYSVNYDLSDLSFKSRFHYSLVDINQLASSNYETVYYADTDHDTFGFFEHERKKNNVTGDCDRDCKKYSLLHRFNPKKEKIQYHLSGNFELEKNALFKQATYDVIEKLNPIMAEAGVPEIELVPALNANSGYNSGDLRYNMINLIDDPLDNGLLGYGPSVANPLTGEIVQAHVNQYSGVARTLSRRTWNALVRHYNRGDIEMCTQTNEAGGKKGVTVSPVAVALAKEAGQEVKPSTQNSGLTKDLNEIKKSANTGNLIASNIAEINALKEEKIKASNLIKARHEGDIRNKALQEDERLLAWGEQTAMDVEAYWISSTVKGFLPGLNPADETLSKNIGTAEEPVYQLIAWDNLSDAAQQKISDAVAVSVYKNTLVHELGHNLGLRHNFNGSNDRDNFYTPGEAHELGLTHVPAYSSVMDYAASELDEPSVWGKYDVAAFRFAYKREIEMVSDSGAAATEVEGETAGDKYCARQLAVEDTSSTATDKTYASLEAYDALYANEVKKANGNNTQDGSLDLPYGVIEFLNSYVDLKGDLEKLVVSDSGGSTADELDIAITAAEQNLTAVTSDVSTSHVQLNGYLSAKSVYDSVVAVKQSSIVLDSAEAAIVLAEKTVEESHGSLNKAQVAYDEILAAKNNAATALAVAQNNAQQATLAVSAAETTLENAETDLQQKIDARIPLEEDVDSKLAALVEAAKLVTEKSEALAQSKTALESANEALTAAQNALAAAQESGTAEDIAAAQAALATAQEAQNAAQQTVDTVNTEYTAAVAGEKTANEVLTAARIPYDQAKESEQIAIEAKATAEENLVLAKEDLDTAQQVEESANLAKTAADEAEQKALAGLPEAIEAAKVDAADELLEKNAELEAAKTLLAEAVAALRAVAIEDLKLNDSDDHLVAKIDETLITATKYYSPIKDDFIEGQAKIMAAQERLLTAQQTKTDFTNRKDVLETAIADLETLLVDGDSKVFSENDIKSYDFCTDGHVSLNSDCNRFDEGTTLAEIVDYQIQRYKDSFEYRATRDGRVDFWEGEMISYASRRYRELQELRDVMENYDRIDNIFTDLFNVGIAPIYSDCQNGATYSFCDWVMETASATEKAGNFMLELAATPDHLCEIKSIEKEQYSLIGLAKLYDSLKWDLPAGYPAPSSCFDEEITKSLKNNNQFTNSHYFDEFGGYVPVEVVSETGRYLNGFNNSDPSHKYSNERAVLGTWVDRVLAIDALVTRESRRWSTDEGSSALIDVPSIRAKFEKFAKHMTLGYYMDEAINFKDKNGESVALNAEYTFDDTAEIEEPVYYMASADKAFLGLNDFGRTNLTAALFRNVHWGADIDNGLRTDWAESAKELMDMTSVLTYSSANGELNALTTTYNGYVYQATESHEIAYEVMTYEDKAAELKKLASAGNIGQIFSLRTQDVHPALISLTDSASTVASNVGTAAAIDDIATLALFVGGMGVDDAREYLNVIARPQWGDFTTNPNTWFANTREEEKFWNEMSVFSGLENEAFILSLFEPIKASWTTSMSYMLVVSDEIKPAFTWDLSMMAEYANGTLDNAVQAKLALLEKLERD